MVVIAVLLAVIAGVAYFLFGNVNVMRTTTIEVERKSQQAGGELITSMFAGGCFWCVESDFEKVPGVVSVVSGYSGGTNENPTYENYVAGGHKEVIEISYDPEIVSYAELAKYLIQFTDPTDPDGSFYDRGKEYSSALYYENDEEKKIAEEIIARIDNEGIFEVPIVTEVLPRDTFWRAEEYHQDYYLKSPLRYRFYRSSSGRDAFIEKYWGTDTSGLIKKTEKITKKIIREVLEYDMTTWENFEKPLKEVLQSQLTEIQYKITQRNKTERAFQNEYWDNKKEGIYVDVVSGEPLYSSTDKFDSGTGWPSFTQPINKDAVVEKADYRLIIPRTEVRSRYADSHLGHIFNDAPPELGGIRHCINSAALRFVPKEDMGSEGYGELLILFE